MFDTILSDPQFNTAMDRPQAAMYGDNFAIDAERDGYRDYSQAFSGLGRIQRAIKTGPNTYEIIRTKDGSINPNEGEIGTVTVGPDGSIQQAGWQPYAPDSNSKFFGQALGALAIGAGGLGAMGMLGGAGAAAGGVGSGLAGTAGAAATPTAGMGMIGASGYVVPGAGALAGLSTTELAALSASLGAGGAAASGAAGAVGAAGGGAPLMGGGYVVPGSGALSGLSNAQLSALSSSLGGAGAPISGGAGGLTNALSSSLGGNGGGLLGTGISPSQALQWGGNLLGGYMNNKAAGKAQDAQLRAIAESNALLDKWNTQARADNMPALEARNAGLSGYRGLLADPSGVVNDPGYAFGRDQGMQALERSAAARGGLYSGKAAKDTMRFGNDYATTKFDNALNRQGNLAGLGQVGANTLAQTGQTYANNVSNNALSSGNVNASAYVNKANNWGDTLGGIMNNYQTNELLKRYVPGFNGIGGN